MESTNPQQPNVHQTVVVVGKPKSVGAALLLAFFFGPLGLLYVSVSGAIIMFFISLIIAIFTFGFGLVFAWVGCAIWAVVAANNANKKNISGINITSNFGGSILQSQQPPAQSVDTKAEAQAQTQTSSIPAPPLPANPTNTDSIVSNLPDFKITDLREKSEDKISDLFIPGPFSLTNTDQKAGISENITAPSVIPEDSGINSWFVGKNRYFLWLFVGLLFLTGLCFSAYKLGYITFSSGSENNIVAPANSPTDFQKVTAGENSNSSTKSFTPFYIINTQAVKDKAVAIRRVKELHDLGFSSGYLWIPDYASLSGAKMYSVYIGPFDTQKECEAATENYRRDHPDAYGLLVSQEKKRVEIRGVGKVKEKKASEKSIGTSFNSSAISIQPLINLPSNLEQSFLIGAGCSFTKNKNSQTSIFLSDVGGEALMKINNRFVILHQTGDKGNKEYYTGGGYDVIVDAKEVGRGHEYIELEGFLTVKTPQGKSTKIKIYGGCGA